MGITSWSELTATSAPVQMRLFKVFRDEPKIHPLPMPRDFSAPFFAPKFSPSTYLPPPTSLTSFPTHSISRGWVAQSFEEM
jgi:hypothetical protein